MTKTVSVTLENPITAIRKRIAKRKIQKLQKQIDKRQEKISKLNEKFFNDSTKTASETTKKTEAKIDEVEAKFGNKIIFAKNQRNNFYHADKGVIDGKFLEYAESTKWLNVSPNPKDKSQKRVFFNHESNGQKALLTKHAKKAGFEIEFK
jgi:hypothetical protein